MLGRVRREAANTGWCPFCHAWHVLYAGTGRIPVHKRPMPITPPDTGQVLLAASTFDVQHVCPGSNLIPKETKIQDMTMMYTPAGHQHYTPLFEGFIDDAMWGCSGQKAPGFFANSTTLDQLLDDAINRFMDDDDSDDNDDWEDMNNVELDD